MRTINPKRLLGKLSSKAFLKTYWQKRPLLVRGAFDPFGDVLTREDLISLSANSEAPSRLIIERNGKDLWDVRHGPFRKSTFKKLPKNRWTLLVQRVDCFVPAVADLLDHFSFVPSWRLEDVMISTAVRGGNVGAHIDNYDVFLIQAAGVREWQISTKAIQGDDYRPGLKLRLLRSFRPDKTWELHPGDMLYLPPRFAHHGIAKTDDCMTYSVGFRAPDEQEILSAYLAEVVSSYEGTGRYSDPDLKLQTEPGEIGPDAVRRLRNIVNKALANDTDLLRWFGSTVTEPHFNSQPADTGSVLSQASIKKQINAGRIPRRTPGSRIAFAVADKRTLLFVNGEEIVLPLSAAKLAALFSKQRTLNKRDTARILSQTVGKDLLAELIERGALAFT